KTGHRCLQHRPIHFGFAGLRIVQHDGAGADAQRDLPVLNGPAFVPLIPSTVILNPLTVILNPSTVTLNPLTVILSGAKDLVVGSLTSDFSIRKFRDSPSLNSRIDPIGCVQ